MFSPETSSGIFIINVARLPLPPPLYKFELSNYGDCFTVIAFDKTSLINMLISILEAIHFLYKIEKLVDIKKCNNKTDWMFHFTY